MSKYQAYPSYKHSDIGWIGNIPEEWSLKRVKHLFTIRKRIAGELGFNILAVTQRGILIKDIKSGEGQLSMDYSKYQRVNPGDFAMNHMDLLTGYVDISKYDGVTSPDYRVFTLDGDLNCPEYFLYLFQMGYQQKIFFHMGQGASHLGRWRLATDEFNELPFPVPTPKEQRTIAAFLDYETARIDDLIAKQQRLIELLKEKRQAVISHAVTKGLDPNAPMKDSGVEWLGQVPQHWVVKQYRYATQLFRGKFGHRPRNDPSLYDGEYPFIQTGDVARADKYITTYKQTLNEKGRSVSQKFPAGTLCMAIAANIGDTAILDFEAYCPDSVVGFRPNIDVSIEFLRFSFTAALQALEQTSTQSTQANLNLDRIGSVNAVFPPLAEQEALVAKLDKMEKKFDEIEAKAQAGIERLSERRTALISAAVTGKIDLRGWQPPATEDAE